MKKTLFLAVVLVGLIGAFFLMRNQESNQMSTLRKERTFKLASSKNIARIVVDNKKRGRFVFEKAKKGWVVNDSIDVWAPLIRNLLDNLTSFEVDYTPPKALIPTMKKSFEEVGIAIRAFDQTGKELIGFVVGGVTPDEKGTYAQRLDSEHPFIIHAPLLTGGVRGRFDFNVEDLRNRFFFEEQWDQIDRVVVSYPRLSGRSFVLEKEGKDQYEVHRPSSEGGGDQFAIQKGRAEAYLMQFDRQGFEAFKNDRLNRDSITQLEPYASITLERSDGEVKWMKLYPIHPETNILDLSQDYLEKGPFFRYIGEISWGDLILIQDITIGKTLKTYDSFKS